MFEAFSKKYYKEKIDNLKFDLKEEQENLKINEKELKKISKNYDDLLNLSKKFYYKDGYCNDLHNYIYGFKKRVEELKSEFSNVYVGVGAKPIISEYDILIGLINSYSSDAENYFYGTIMPKLKEYMKHKNDLIKTKNSINGKIDSILRKLTYYGMLYTFAKDF